MLMEERVCITKYFKSTDIIVDDFLVSRGSIGVAAGSSDDAFVL
jgi:hypothetical protein